VAAALQQCRRVHSEKDVDRRLQKVIQRGNLTHRPIQINTLYSRQSHLNSEFSVYLRITFEAELQHLKHKSFKGVDVEYLASKYSRVDNEKDSSADLHEKATDWILIDVYGSQSFTRIRRQ
jgi:hypothetical protein